MSWFGRGRHEPEVDEDELEAGDLDPDYADYEDDELYDDEPIVPPRRRHPFRAAFVGLLLGVSLSIAAILTAATFGRAAAFGGTGFNVLVLGTDQRPDERGLDPGRTDSIVLVSIGGASSPISVVSVPRDLWVAIPGYGEGRINTAYRSAELDRPGTGGALAKRVVGDALGVRIDRYALVDMHGVRDIVNQLGGIDLDIPEALADDAFPTDDYGTMSVSIPAGRQHLNGDLALAYARSRHQDSDFGRMARQQQVIGAIAARLKSPAEWLRIPALVNTANASVQTDLTRWEMASLAPSLVDLTGDSAHRLVVGPDLVTPLTGDDGAALLLPGASLKPTVKAFLQGS